MIIIIIIWVLLRQGLALWAGLELTMKTRSGWYDSPVSAPKCRDYRHVPPCLARFSRFSVVGIELSASYMLDKYSTTEINPRFYYFSICLYPLLMLIFLIRQQGLQSINFFIPIPNSANT
jgi:hypothetical protein